MEKLSNEELVELHMIISRTSLIQGDKINVAKELLRRLEAGDRAIKACKEIAAMELEAK